MIWDHVVFGPKIDQKPGFWPTPWEVLQNSSKLSFLGSKTLKNTQKHSKTFKNTPNMPGIALVTPRGHKDHCKISNFSKNHKNPSVKGQHVLDGCF